MEMTTIRNIPPGTAAALDVEKQRGSLSLGVHGTVRSNGLGRFAGTWSAEEFKRFEDAVASFGEVDEDTWR